jgi:hypothetical protein
MQAETREQNLKYKVCDLNVGVANRTDACVCCSGHRWLGTHEWVWGSGQGAGAIVAEYHDTAIHVFGRFVPVHVP